MAKWSACATTTATATDIDRPPRPIPPTAVEHVWTYDFLFDACANGQQRKSLAVLDEFSRGCLAIDVAGSIRSGRVIEFLAQRAIVAGLFLVTFALTSVTSNTAAALVMLPIAVATGVEMGVSPMALIIAVTVGAHAALLTPVATPVNLMVVGPGGYKFGDYWKYGLPIGIWWLVVVSFLVPLYWKF